ncbi:MAG TPA: hypothetical protein VMA72_20735 [Streptosporangiaceae bacterium]|nr:hypothetical protein [Streptosporangiaceae bacterium]
MNDDELMTALREQRGKIPMTTPVEQIISRSRVLRARRRIPGVAATLGAVAATAIAVTVALPANHQDSHQPAVRLAAWTVTKLAHGDISVTIRELKDPAGLQRKLRAEGVPASVTFASHPNPACRPYPGGAPQPPPRAATRLLHRVFPEIYRDIRQSPRKPVVRRATSRHLRVGAVNHRPPGNPRQQTIVIRPSALPGNAGVQIATSYGGPHGTKGVGFPAVVYASPRCTGS